VPRRIDEVTAQLAGRDDAIDRTDLLGPAAYDTSRLALTGFI
jgi:hypothetical protein